MQFYKTNTIDEYQMLVGETVLMYASGNTVEDISICIKQPVNNVIACIEFCRNIF